MTTPTVYKWTDTDAPRPETVGSSSHYGHKYLLEILKACLVDGYGEKAAAGWTLEHWDDTAEAQRAGFGNGNGIIELIASSSYGTYVALHESVTSWGVGNTDGTGGEGMAYESCWSEGVNSQTDYDAEYSRDSSNGILAIYSRYVASGAAGEETDSTGWVVVATDKTFIFFTIGSPSTVSTSTVVSTPSARTTLYATLVAGAYNVSGMARDDVGNFMAAAPYLANKTSSASSSYYDGLASTLVALRNPFGSEKVATDLMYIYLTDIDSNNARNYKSPVVYHAPVVLYYSGDANPDTYNNEEYGFGSMPGMRMLNGSYNHVGLRDHIEKIEAGGDGRQYCDWVSFDGYDCFPCILDASGNVQSGLITTDPAYWP